MKTKLVDVLESTLKMVFTSHNLCVSKMSLQTSFSSI
jgi:hypothetical protein